MDKTTTLILYPKHGYPSAPLICSLSCSVGDFGNPFCIRTSTKTLVLLGLHASWIHMGFAARCSTISCERFMMGIPFQKHGLALRMPESQQSSLSSIYPRSRPHEEINCITCVLAQSLSQTRSFHYGGSMSSASRVWTGAVAGLISHNAFFIRGEHHLRAPAVLCLGLIGFFVIFLTSSRSGRRLALCDALLTVGSFVTALFTSMTVYRIVFHPLRSFKGPFLNRISKLWHLFHVCRISNHTYLDSLYRQYGDVVRTGKCYYSQLGRAILTIYRTL